MSRTVLLHYHLFKNAGTSLDEVLKRNFGSKWVTREFEEAHKKELTQWILDNPEAQAFSSHTIAVPPPELPGVKVIPLVFLRHPIDRIASAYAFERKQSSAEFGAVLARNTSLAGYVEVRLSIGSDQQCRNFHTHRFAAMSPKGLTPDPALAFQHATEVLQELPFVGIVEDFAGSMERLGALLAPHFPDFKAQTVAANVSREHTMPLEQKLAKLRADLGEPLYEQLEEANRWDLAFYAQGLQRVQAPAAS